ncbi:Pyruvate dehydrogenase complex component Pdx1 [Penicillium coprophilum]|uniref:Pyruvate dehydrogenase complex component Pdx1 n=1 Tax=Penicillium coprophilum TaxID=36646 RepID=UPI0023946C72|nr:Pyruvate dehydrogenase complex component Pdx1 [Penicillium coprophilum]KAJ5154237.1 Pyruvate dehydrogenase complex component Pdx1 [Penicillium coprophilum]
MAAKMTVGQVPAMFSRRQQKVFGISRRLQSTSHTIQNPAYPLYPSVAQLLREKGIPKSDISKIPASGPKGRLLKGDVLAYIGQIPANYPSTQAATLAKLSHLDLSNIKIAPAPAAPAAAEEKAVAEPLPMTSVAISISLAAVLSAQKKLQDNLGVTVPLSRFLAVATDLANDDLPRLASSKPSADELFDEVLGAAAINTSRGEYIPELNAFESPKTVRSKPVTEDLIDFLSAKSSKKSVSTISVESSPGVASNVFSLTVPAGEEVRARAFLERIKTLLSIEPARLVL